MSEKTKTDGIIEWFKNRSIEIILVTLGSALAYLLKIDALIATSIIGLTLFLLNIFIYIYHKKKDRNYTALSNFKSFIFNEPPLPRGDKPVTILQRLLVISDSSDSCRNVSIEIEKYFEPILKSHFQSLVIKLDNSDIENQEDDLYHDLANAQSVIVFRTAYFESNYWVYDTIEKWATKNGDIPFLWIDNIDDAQKRKIALNKIPQRYKFIKLDDIKNISFKLLHRAINRAYDWKRLAQFNRRISALLIIVVTIIFTILFQEIEGLNKKILGLNKSLLDEKRDINHFKSIGEKIIGNINNLYKDDLENSKKTSVELNHLAEETIYAICKYNQINDSYDNIKISFWTKSNDTIYEIARSKYKDHYSGWLITSKSIVAGSFRNPMKCIFWSKLKDSCKVFMLENPKENIGESFMLDKIPSIVIKDRNDKRDSVSFINSTTNMDAIKNILCYWSEGGFGIYISSEFDNYSFLNTSGTLNIIKIALNDIELCHFNIKPQDIQQSYSLKVH